jgi:hypothetical protein
MTNRTGRPPSAFRLNLEQQKNRAKDLLRAAKAEDAEALSRLEAVRRNSAAPNLADAHRSNVKLADAQFVIARELRFASWAKLKSHIESMDRQREAIDGKRRPLDGDLKTLHIRCGHDIKDKLVEGGFVGDFLVHAIPYCLGPVTKGPDRHELMARFLAGHVQDVDVYERELEGLPRGEELLHRTAEDYERVVIWMEHDNWDQLCLVRLLAHYANAQRPRVLELIVLDDFPGSERFIGLGQLPPEALRLLWPSRRSVTAAQLALGNAAWDALASDDPRNLAALARSGTPALPIMAPALHLLLRELPSVENGLRLTEHLILQIVSEGTAGPMRAWGDVWPLLKKREPIPWVTDLWFRDVINYMLAVAEPVMTFTRIPPLPGHTSVETPGKFLQLLAITELGRAVLRGELDWLSLRPHSRWVGGVHIQPGVASWRWDEAKRDAVLWPALTFA